MRNYLAGPNRDVPANWAPPKAVDTADEALIAKIAAGNRLRSASCDRALRLSFRAKLARINHAPLSSSLMCQSITNA